MVASSAKNEITDNELLRLYKCDKNNLALSVLFERYKPLIIARIKSFNFSKSDFEDVFQECMIVLFTAINSYKSEVASFNTYATICINRALISIYRQKSTVGELLEDDISSKIDETVFTEAENPQNIIENNDNFSELISIVKSSLSKREFAVLKYLFAGHKYSEIAEKLSISVKSVDNAIQRIRNKFNNI